MITDSKKEKTKTFLILHNIRSSHNVGAIFRTADATGITHIYLTGYTPAPTDKFGRKNTKLSKSALGAEDFVSWTHKKNISTLLKSLKKEKTLLVAIEQAKKSESIFKIKPKAQTAFIFGNEVRGLSLSVLSQVNKVFEIPMLGEKESLNVSVAVGVVLYEYLRVSNS